MAHLSNFLCLVGILSLSQEYETKNGKAKGVAAAGFAFLKKAKPKIFYAKLAFCYTGQRTAFHQGAFEKLPL